MGPEAGQIISLSAELIELTGKMHFLFHACALSDRASTSGENMSSESEGDNGSSAARYRSIGVKRSRGSEEPENGAPPVIKRINTSSLGNE